MNSVPFFFSCFTLFCYQVHCSGSHGLNCQAKALGFVWQNVIKAHSFPFNIKF